MPQSATLEAIKAYQKQLGKGKIKPDDLPPCSRCELEAVHFKEHAFRERIFLVIIEMIIQTINCSLLRFKCPGCGKTVTWYPEFAIPYKRYTVSTVIDFSEAYVKNIKKTYETARRLDLKYPAYPEDGKMLAPSSIHRFITSLSGLENIKSRAIELILQKDPVSGICRKLGQIEINRQKYKSERRKDQLTMCLGFLNIAETFERVFGLSVFTNLARREAFR